MDICNVGILAQHYTASPWRWRHRRPPKRWYPTTTIHGVTTQKTWTWTEDWVMIREFSEHWVHYCIFLLVVVIHWTSLVTKLRTGNLGFSRMEFVRCYRNVMDFLCASDWF